MDARVYGPTDRPRESLTTIGRCALATRPNNTNLYDLLAVAVAIIYWDSWMCLENANRWLCKRSLLTADSWVECAAIACSRSISPLQKLKAWRVAHRTGRGTCWTVVAHSTAVITTALCSTVVRSSASSPFAWVYNAMIRIENEYVYRRCCCWLPLQASNEKSRPCLTPKTKSFDTLRYAHSCVLSKTDRYPAYRFHRN